MKVKEYLETVLRDQTLASNGEELTKLREEKQNVEALLQGKFKQSQPEIRYGGSRAKKTMIKAAYDLDLTCYFSHNDDGAGETLKEIYDSVKAALESDYFTEAKTSAIRLRSLGDQVDFHIDVVPGRFVEDKDGDVFIHQATAEKGRLKTNLDIHIKHIRDSRVTDAVRLSKLWRERNRLSVKTFVLELLVVDLLKDKETGSLENQLKHVWTEFRDNGEGLSVEDPANPSGNDLSGYLDSVRCALESAARVTMAHVETDNWEAIFGKVQEESEEERVASLGRIAATVTTREKPWCRGR